MTRFRYNEKGNVIEEVYYGYNKQLDKEYIGSYKKYEYDENGVRTKTIILDSKENIIFEKNGY